MLTYGGEHLRSFWKKVALSWEVSKWYMESPQMEIEIKKKEFHIETKILVGVGGWGRGG